MCGLTPSAPFEKISQPESAGAPPGGLRLSPTVAAWELACLVFCVEAIMWIVPLTRAPRVGYAGLALVTAGLLAVGQARDGARPRELGLRLDNALHVLARIAPALGAFVVLLVAIGLLAGTLRFGEKFFSMLATVPLWALLQQYMLLAFANRRLRLLVGPGRRSVFATAALFSLMHLPNPTLTLACAAGGYIWAREYERSPNLIANALTHAVASAFLANSLPPFLLKNMVVGYAYFLK